MTNFLDCHWDEEGKNFPNSIYSHRYYTHICMLLPSYFIHGTFSLSSQFIACLSILYTHSQNIFMLCLRNELFCFFFYSLKRYRKILFTTFYHHLKWDRESSEWVLLFNSCVKNAIAHCLIFCTASFFSIFGSFTWLKKTINLDKLPPHYMYMDEIRLRDFSIDRKCFIFWSREGLHRWW